jgi:ribose transport system substrate-binding protein
MIIGVMDALKKAKDQPQRVLIGFDAIGEAKEAVQQGHLTATIAQQPKLMGKLSIDTAVRYFRGQAIKSNLLVDLSVITR